MSPFMVPFVLGVLVCAVVFAIGLVLRNRRMMLIGFPGALLLGIWFCLASSRPNPQKAFDQLFGADNRDLASGVRTIKPTLMDGYFISFHMRPADFEARVRPQFAEIGLASPPHMLLGQALPQGWPVAIENATSALHRKVGYDDVYLVYVPENETAYASVRYDSW